jgi:hypothetical protein
MMATVTWGPRWNLVELEKLHQNVHHNVGVSSTRFCPCGVKFEAGRGCRIDC